MRVKECMCNNLVKATPETSVAEAAKLMNSNQIGCLPICSTDDRVVGFVTDRDIITSMGQECIRVFWKVFY